MLHRKEFIKSRRARVFWTMAAGAAVCGLGHLLEKRITRGVLLFVCFICPAYCGASTFWGGAQTPARWLYLPCWGAALAVWIYALTDLWETLHCQRKKPQTHPLIPTSKIPEPVQAVPAPAQAAPSPAPAAKDTDALYEQARTHQLKGNIEAAAEDYETILHSRPEDGDCLFQLGKIRLAQNHREQAEELFARCRKTGSGKVWTQEIDDLLGSAG